MTVTCKNTKDKNRREELCLANGIQQVLLTGKQNTRSLLLYLENPVTQKGIKMMNGDPTHDKPQCIKF